MCQRPVSRCLGFAFTVEYKSSRTRRFCSASLAWSMGKGGMAWHFGRSCQKWHFGVLRPKAIASIVLVHQHTVSPLSCIYSPARLTMLLRPLLSATCLLASSAQALFFYLDGTTPKCFYEELPKDTLVVGQSSHSHHMAQHILTACRPLQSRSIQHQYELLLHYQRPRNTSNSGRDLRQ